VTATNINTIYDMHNRNLPCNNNNNNNSNWKGSQSVMTTAKWYKLRVFNYENSVEFVISLYGD